MIEETDFAENLIWADLGDFDIPGVNRLSD